MKIEVIAQYISLLATIFTILGILGKKKETVMLWFSLYNVVILATYFMLGRYTGSILVFVTLFKSILFYILAKKNIEPKLWILLLFEISYIAISIIFWDSYIELILVANLLLVTYLCWQSNMKLLKYGYLVSTALLITYDILVGAYTTIIAEVAFLISNIISLYFVYHPRKNANEKQKDTNVVIESNQTNTEVQQEQN